MKLTFVDLSESYQQLLDGFAMRFGSGSHVPLKMNCNNFGDSLTFHLLLLGQYFNLCNTLFYAQMSTKHANWQMSAC